MYVTGSFRENNTTNRVISNCESSDCINSNYLKFCAKLRISKVSFHINKSIIEV